MCRKISFLQSTSCLLDVKQLYACVGSRFGDVQPFLGSIVLVLCVFLAPLLPFSMPHLVSVTEPSRVCASSFPLLMLIDLPMSFLSPMIAWILFWLLRQAVLATPFLRKPLLDHFQPSLTRHCNAMLLLPISNHTPNLCSRYAKFMEKRHPKRKRKHLKRKDSRFGGVIHPFLRTLIPTP